jgi:cell division protein FtsI (penicillin-binding protein 3)
VKVGFAPEASYALNRLNITNQIAGSSAGFATATHLREKIIFKAAAAKSGLLPDLTGMGARDAVFLLENLGFKVQLQGRGAVVQQLPVPGTRMKKGSQVIIQLG